MRLLILVAVVTASCAPTAATMVAENAVTYATNDAPTGQGCRVPKDATPRERNQYLQRCMGLASPSSAPSP